MARAPVKPMDPAEFIGRSFALEGLLLTAVEAIVDTPGATPERKRDVLKKFRQNAAALAKQALEPWKGHPKYDDTVKIAEAFVDEQMDLLEQNLIAMAGDGVVDAEPKS